MCHAKVGEEEGAAGLAFVKRRLMMAFAEEQLCQMNDFTDGDCGITRPLGRLESCSLIGFSI